MANPITIVNVTQTVAPTPNKLQQSGAFVSQGGTTTAPGTLTLLTSSASLTAILAGSKPVTSITQTAGVATMTTTAVHGIANGEVVPLIVSGATPAAYNGVHECTVTGVSTVTFPIASGTTSPATGTISYTAEDVSELVAMNTTFFAQPGIKSVYVLELGLADAADGVTALATWITANPNRVYSWLVPSEWDAEETYLPFLQNFTGTDKKTYFFTTIASGSEAKYAGLKCVLVLEPSPTASASEFGSASYFSSTLGWKPSSTQQVPPLEYVFLFGTTAWSPYGNQTEFATFASNNVNYAGSGSEGGITNTVLFGGNTQDGNPFNFWYSVDWMAINGQQAVTNAIINGSNSPPFLYYNQAGINRLQAVLARVARSAVSFGLAQGQVITTQLPYATFAENVANGLYDGQIVVNAEPFSVYTAENPDDYAIGKYGGLAVNYAPLRGFDQVIINLNATTFVS